MTEKRKMMEAVYANGFAADDARLFLDTHPHDKNALDYYNRKMELYHQAVSRYEEKFGPYIVTQNDVCADRWAWVDDPWPWEYCGQEDM